MIKIGNVKAGRVRIYKFNSFKALTKKENDIRNDKDKSNDYLLEEIAKNKDIRSIDRKYLYYNDKEARFTLVQLLLSFRKSIDNERHYKRSLEKFSNEFNIEMMNGNLIMGNVDQMSVFGEFCDPSLIIYIGDGQISPFFYQKKKSYEF